MINREISSTITSKGQVTLPAEVRRRLGVNVHDRITYVIDGDSVRIRPAQHTLDSIRGAVPARGIESADGRREIEIAMEDRLVRKYGRGSAK